MMKRTEEIKIIETSHLPRDRQQRKVEERKVAKKEGREKGKEREKGRDRGSESNKEKKKEIAPDMTDMTDFSLEIWTKKASRLI